MMQKNSPGQPNSFEIDVTRQAGAWNVEDDFFTKVVGHTLAHFKIIGPVEISIVLADDTFVRVLNRDYRDKDNPTNVLSFPQLGPQEIESGISGHIGDIVIALETVQAEAGRDEKSFEDHLSHLTIHGLLHLLGMDHQQESEAENMESLEAEILAALSIKNPYET